MRVDELALALRDRDALRARVLYAELILDDPRNIEPPERTDELLQAIAASIVELIAVRLGTVPPDWTQHIGPLPQSYLLVTVRTAAKLERLLLESPRELLARNLVAPANFLLSA